jgi:ATP-dependent helicase/nuclease subunit A
LNGPDSPPSSVEMRRADRQARRLAQHDFDRPVVLEAGAGTGKTTTLVARVLAWCLGPGWLRATENERQAWRDSGRQGEPPADRIAARLLDGVVAITFTEAAAAEMADKAARELARLARSEAEQPAWLVAELPPPDERAARAAALLGALDHLVVRTIHAFCRGLLAEHPLAAGLHPDLEIDADGSRVEEVARETVESVLAEAYGEHGDGPYLALAARGIGPRELVEALTVLAAAGLPAGALDADLLGDEEVAAFRRRLAGACRRLVEVVGPLRLRLSLETRQAAADVATQAAGDGELADLVAAVAEHFPDNRLNRLKDWCKGRWAASEQALVAGREGGIATAAAEAATLLAHARRLDPELLELARRALAPLLATARRELRAQGVASFDDLLAEAERLLRSRPDVRRRLRLRIDQLLVDELQDTDRQQCDIVRLLALDGPPEERPGLFLVGDPKQSIYGWRNADLAAYEALIADVRASGGVVLPLVENFRSVPSILDEVTRAIEPVMIETPELQPRFQRLLACESLAAQAGFTSGGAGTPPGRVLRGAVEHWVSWRLPRDAGDRRAGAATTSEGAAEVEAQAIARDLADLHRREGVAWGEAALLLRTTTSLDVYLEALRREGVPFAVGRDTQYYRRREVIEAAALIRAVLDPGDHVALLTLLRSPLAGVPDAALVPLWSQNLPSRLTDLVEPEPAKLAEISVAIAEASRAMPRDVPGLDRVAGWETSLAAAVEALAAARHSFRHDPADLFVDKLRRRFFLEPGEAARYLGAYRLANLERFFRHLTTALDEGGGDVTAALRALRKSVAEAHEAEEGKPREGAEDAVQVMTIHQAKGLDFAHVYLPQLHRESGGDRGPRTEVARRGDAFELRLFGAPSLGWDLVETERARVEAAERVRLLYVAMTRAKVRLVLCARWPRQATPTDLERVRHHLDLLTHRESSPTDLLARWEAAATATGPGDDDGTVARAPFADPVGGLWRFAALAGFPAADGDAAERPGLPDAERVAAESGELVERRRRARHRMERPFSATASEEAHQRLREAMATEGGAEDAGRAARSVAMAAGTAIHRALEELDPGADPTAELERLRRRLPVSIAQVAVPADRPAALAEAEAVLSDLPGGRLWQRLREIAPGIVARELPLLLAPDPAAGDVGEGEGRESPEPVGFISGAIDLVYRDPADDAWVVADYKTDRLAPDEVDARAAVYTPQGAVYARAVQEALDLPQPPRIELWFLRPDRIVGSERTDAPDAPATTPPPATEDRPPVQGTLFDLGELEPRGH